MTQTAGHSFGNVGGMFNQNLSNRVHVLRVGLNYLFGWPR